MPPSDFPSAPSGVSSGKTSKKKSGGPLAVLVPVVAVVGVAYAICSLLRKKKKSAGGREDEKVVDLQPIGRFHSFESDKFQEILGSPAGEFHDADADLVEESGSPMQPLKLQSRFGEGSTNGVPATSEITEESPGADGQGEGEEGEEREDEGAAGSKLNELLKRAQGANNKLSQLVDENVTKS